MHSVTKLIGGHSDLTLGAVVGPRELIDRIRSVASTFGQTGNPFESWLALRGVSTLSLRIGPASANAPELARRLESHSSGCPRPLPRPSLPSRFRPCPPPARQRLRRHGHLRRRRPQPGQSPDPSLEHIPFAPSLGDVQTTLSHPCSTSHRGQDPPFWSGWASLRA